MGSYRLRLRIASTVFFSFARCWRWSLELIPLCSRPRWDLNLLHLLPWTWHLNLLTSIILLDSRFWKCWYSFRTLLLILIHPLWTFAYRLSHFILALSACDNSSQISIVKVLGDVILIIIGVTLILFLLDFILDKNLLSWWLLLKQLMLGILWAMWGTLLTFLTTLLLSILLIWTF